MVESPIIVSDFMPNKMEQANVHYSNKKRNLDDSTIFQQRPEFVTRGFKSERERIQV